LSGLAFLSMGRISHHQHSKSQPQEINGMSNDRKTSSTRKVNQAIRIDPDIPAAYWQEGEMWQTLIRQVLRQNMPTHQT